MRESEVEWDEKKSFCDKVNVCVCVLVYILYRMSKCDVVREAEHKAFLEAGLSPKTGHEQEDNKKVTATSNKTLLDT